MRALPPSSKSLRQRAAPPSCNPPPTPQHHLHGTPPSTVSKLHHPPPLSSSQQQQPSRTSVSQQPPTTATSTTNTHQTLTMASLDIAPEVSRSYQKVISSPALNKPSPTYAQWAIFSVSAPLQNAFVQSSNKASVLKVQASGGSLSSLRRGAQWARAGSAS